MIQPEVDERVIDPAAPVYNARLVRREDETDSTMPAGKFRVSLTALPS